MQEKFIDELENRGKKDIEDKKGKIKNRAHFAKVD